MTRQLSCATRAWITTVLIRVSVEWAKWERMRWSWRDGCSRTIRLFMWVDRCCVVDRNSINLSLLCQAWSQNIKLVWVRSKGVGNTCARRWELFGLKRRWAVPSCVPRLIIKSNALARSIINAMQVHMPTISYTTIGDECNIVCRESLRTVEAYRLDYPPALISNSDDTRTT